MFRTRIGPLALAASAIVALAAYAIVPGKAVGVGEVDRKVDVAEDDCGCTWTEEPLLAAEFAALPMLARAGSAFSAAVTMHVEDIRVSWTHASGWNKRPNVRVRVLDGTGAPVYGATVTGDWSGCFVDNGDIGVTGDLDLNGDGQITEDEKGWAYIVSSKTGSCRKKQCYFTFTVTNVTRSGDSYGASQNVETSDFAKCDLLKS